MAKQSGLHQLKGKVDGYSYYRQSGVKAGLMRRINEGMSARVKSSEEFANTRLNNSEFGNAADVAKVLASVITPKFRPMFLNFSQAKLTKSLLSLIKQATGDWGQRALAAGDVQAVCDAVNMLAKNDFGSFCDAVSSSEGSSAGSTAVNVAFSADNAETLAAIGADGIAVKASFICVNAGLYSAQTHQYVKSVSTILEDRTQNIPLADLEQGFDHEGQGVGESISGTAKLEVTLVLLMPYRTINSKKYTLQEKCTFKMIPSVVAE